MVSANENRTHGDNELEHKSQCHIGTAMVEHEGMHRHEDEVAGHWAKIIQLCLLLTDDPTAYNQVVVKQANRPEFGRSYSALLMYRNLQKE